ncbi:hypothetical protein OAN307_c35360 [Octadecabacter antarcticus 307]|uniref:Uncharacterized protein n=1 Tax=Octadecabacter antarcticus 307 TaxID=391626 RepID=M9R8P8_9RHOB|nr:hypothetical protein OAN307_c35360 [Octadecabacter antarcticus 307]
MVSREGATCARRNLLGLMCVVPLTTVFFMLFRLFRRFRPFTQLGQFKRVSGQEMVKNYGTEDVAAP